MLSTGRRLLILTNAKHEKRVHIRGNLRVMSGKPRALLESSPKLFSQLSSRVYGLKSSSFDTKMGIGQQLNGTGTHMTVGKCEEERLITRQLMKPRETKSPGYSVSSRLILRKSAYQRKVRSLILDEHGMTASYYAFRKTRDLGAP